MRRPFLRRDPAGGANVPSAVVPAIDGGIVARESHGRARCHILLRLLLGVREFFAARAIPGKLKHVLSLLHCARAEGFMICGVWRADAGVWPYAGMIGRGFEQRRPAKPRGVAIVPGSGACGRTTAIALRGPAHALGGVPVRISAMGWKTAIRSSRLNVASAPQPAVSNRSNIYSITSSARASSGLRPTRTPTAFLNWG